MKYFKVLLVVFLVFAFSDVYAQRAPIKMSGKTIEGTEAGSGSILQVNPANLVAGDIFIVEFQGDSSFGYQKFIYKFDTESEEVHNSPWVLDPTRDTDYGRWLLVDASEWPCDPSEAGCYLDLPINTGDASAPGPGIVRFFGGGDGNLYYRLDTGDPVEVGSFGDFSSDGLDGQLYIIGQGFTEVDNAPVVHEPTEYTPVDNLNLSGHLLGIETELAKIAGLEAQLAAIEALLGTTTFAAVSVTPTEWSFGNVNLNSTSDKEFTFTSAGTESLVVGTVALSGDNADQFSIQADACSDETVTTNCAVTIRFAPDAAASAVASLDLPSNAPAGTKSVSLSGTGVGTTTRYFGSDFETIQDRAQWTSVDANFNLACGSACNENGPLAGTYSGLMVSSTAYRYLIADSVVSETGAAVYARVAFKALNSPTTTGGALVMRLRAEEVDQSLVMLQNGTNGIYRLYASTDTGSTYANVSNERFDDATYFLQLVYTKGVSTVASIRNAANEVLYTHTLNNAGLDADIDSIGIQSRYINFLVDRVEVRGDDSWEN